MLSVCGCVINSKYDVQMLIEALHAHNQDTEFEICLTHDDRVDDGSAEHFSKLEKQYSNLTFIRHTHEDTVDYLRQLMDYYQANGIFTHILPQLREELEKFARKELFDHSKTFLWLSSGRLYNKAIEASKGDIVLVGPADFSYMFRLKDLEAHVNAHARNGHFYAKPNAIWARLTNQDPDWLKQHVDEVHRGIGNNELYRWDSRELFKDYLRYPPKLEDFYIPDFRNNKLISWADPNCIDDLYTYSTQSISQGGVQYIPGFHGVHVMTRLTYEAIGGFSCLHCGRAFADDQMTQAGKRFPTGGPLPPRFSFAWTFPAELLPTHGQGYPEGWQELIKEKDLYYGRHPIPPHDKPVYLHSNIMSDHEMAALATRTFSKAAPPVRIAI